MENPIVRWLNTCVLHAYRRQPVMQVRDAVCVTLSARICRRCGHCHSGDWQHARRLLAEAHEAGLGVEVLPCISREVHRPVLALPVPCGGRRPRLSW